MFPERRVVPDPQCGTVDCLLSSYSPPIDNQSVLITSTVHQFYQLYPDSRTSLRQDHEAAGPEDVRPGGDVPGDVGLAAANLRR